MTLLKLINTLFFLPIIILWKLLTLFIPILLIIIIGITVVKYPFNAISYLIGFLMSPIILRYISISSTTSMTGIEEFTRCRDEIKTMETMKETEINTIQKQYENQEKQIHEDTKQIMGDTSHMKDWYYSMLNRKPDKILFLDFESLSIFEKIKKTIFNRRQ